LLEKSLVWANSLEELSIKGDFNDIAGFGAKIGGRVRLVDDAGRENTLDVSHVHIRELDLLGYEVDVPDSDGVVVNAKQFCVGVVKEPDLVGGASSDWISANGLTGLDIPDNQLVIILSSE
jgi:hypothetical protein